MKSTGTMQGIANLVNECFGSRAANEYVQTRLRAKLSQTLRARVEECGGNRVGTLPQRALEYHDGIHTAHLGVNRDGHGA